MKNKWWEISINKLVSVLSGETEEEKFIKAFDIKYGNYDYRNDLRSLAEYEFETFIEDYFKGVPLSSNIIICGANSGYEIPYLGGFNLTALDISPSALERLRSSYPYVRTLNANINRLPFEDASFNVYINLRSIQSQGVDFQKAVSEAIRVIKKGGDLLFSIPNGYINNGHIMKGMWDSDIQELKSQLPYTLCDKLTSTLKSNGVKNIEKREITSEIFIFGKK